ncbi:chemotaxis protein CheW [Candidatus Nomurabacteria bacterium]|nr:chemotaxis protein CheW [Candidatus Nomurabacteria bacterium]
MNSEKYKDFYLETSRDQLRKLSDLFLAWEKKSTDPYLLEDILSLLHSMKGAAVTMDYQNTGKALHLAEDVFYAILHKDLELSSLIIETLFRFLESLENNFDSLAKKGKESSFQAVFNNLQKIVKNKASKKQSKKKISSETIINLNHSRSFFRTPLELVIPTYRLDKIQSIVDNLSIAKININSNIKNSASDNLLKSCANIDKIVSDLRREIEEIRLLPVAQIFSPLPRLVRQLAKDEEKKVDLIIEDNNLSLDKSILDDLMDIVIQLLRNAVVHGIDKKQDNGQIIVRVELVDGRVRLMVADNGHGIDWQEVVKLSVRKKIISQAEAKKLNILEIKQLLFSNRFSSQKVVTLNSGRGVGLSLVKKRVDDLNGNISLESSKAHGARFIIDLPLYTSVFRALVFQLADFYLAIPLVNIQKIIRLPKIETFSNQKSFVYKKINYRLLSLKKIIGANLSLSTQNLLLIKFNDQEKLLAVPQNLKEEEVVMKRQPKILKDNPIVSSAAVASDGRVILILNMHSLMQ